jgi:hypothetical protein
VGPFTVAIMQPYFIPYAGYFRLLTASDLFVVYDCVQFPRRGWVHRNQMTDRRGAPQWLTLPLEKAPQETLIRDLRFPPGAAEMLAERLQPFPMQPRDEAAFAPVGAALRDVRDTPALYIERLLQAAAAYCGAPWNVVRSSSLDVPADLHGQERILEIARRVGAERYVNAPGGRALYDPDAFDRAGIELRFLAPYEGPTVSILERILRDDPAELAADIADAPGRLAP